MNPDDIGGMPAKRGKAILYLKRRGRYCLDQKVHRIGSAPWVRQRRREHEMVVPEFLRKQNNTMSGEHK